MGLAAALPLLLRALDEGWQNLYLELSSQHAERCVQHLLKGVGFCESPVSEVAAQEDTWQTCAH